MLLWFYFACHTGSRLFGRVPVYDKLYFGAVINHLYNPFIHRLALYVYEYLLHVGAQKAAQTFLSEVRLLITWPINNKELIVPRFLYPWSLI